MEREKIFKNVGHVVYSLLGLYSKIDIFLYNERKK